MIKRPTALLLHAAGSTPGALGTLAQGFERRGLLVASPALPLGVDRDAARRGAPLARQVAVARAAQTTAQEGQSPGIVFGHSFGGLVALTAFAPSACVAALVLYEPIVLGALDDRNAGDTAARAWDRELIDAIARGVDAGVPEASVKLFIEAYNEIVWERLPAKARAGILAGAADLRDLTQAVHHLVLDRAALARCALPVLVLRGTRSPDVTRRMAERLARLLPQASYADVENAGHMGPVLAPDAVLAAIAPFLDRLGIGAPTPAPGLG